MPAPSAPSPLTLPAPDYPEVAKRVRNMLRPYSGQSIISVALNTLYEQQGKDVLEDVKSAPWITLLIVKVILQDKTIPLHAGPDCPAEVFRRCRQLLWETRRLLTDTPQRLTLSIRAMVYPQMLFQQPVSINFIRWPALVARLADDHPIRKVFVQSLGMDPMAFVGLCLAVHVIPMHGGDRIEPGHLERLQPLFGDAVTEFYARFSRTMDELRDELREELEQILFEVVDGKKRNRPGAEPRPHKEQSEFPWFSKYPLLQLGHIHAIWHPLVFARGIENACHRLMSERGQEYTDDFSKLFESYVIELTEEAGLTGVSDLQFKKMHDKATPAVDLILPFAGVNVLVECKMSMFTDDVLISDAPGVIFRKLKRAREAIVQGWRVGSLLRDSPVKLQDCAAAAQDFLLVVTSRQLLCSNGRFLESMLGKDVFQNINPENKFTGPSEAQLARLPPQNIIILSISEFEHLMSLVRDQIIYLPELLAESAANAGDAARDKLYFDQLLQEKVKGAQWRQPQMLEHMRTRITGLFEAHFGPGGSGAEESPSA